MQKEMMITGMNITTRSGAGKMKQERSDLKDAVSSFREEEMHPLKLKEHPEIWFRIKYLQNRYYE